MRILKPYLSTLRLRALLELQYRGAAIGGLFCQGFFGLIYVFLYTALYQSGGEQSTTLSQTITYVWLQQAFFRLICGSDGALTSDIMSGNVVYSLCRPVDLYSYWFARDVAYRVIGSVMRATPMLILALVLPAPIGLSLPSSPAALAAFLCSLLLGMLVQTAIFSLMFAGTLITLDNRGITNVLSMFNLFAVGNVLPLTLFPDSWQRFIISSPFAQSLDVPIRYYTGQLMVSDLPGTIAMQLIWLIVLVAAGWSLWRYALNRMVIQGG